MEIKFKNKWNTPNKSSKKVAAKLRIGKVTVLDLYFTVGDPRVTFTFMNFTFTLDKPEQTED